jgi:hypothetical protein
MHASRTRLAQVDPTHSAAQQSGPMLVIKQFQKENRIVKGVRIHQDSRGDLTSGHMNWVPGVGRPAPWKALAD